MSTPVLTIVAGCNGSGKSSLTYFARNQFQQSPILDPDAVARSLQSSLARPTSNLEAGKEVLRRAAKLLAARQSFAVETTLSGSTYLRMAEDAKSAGFAVVVLFIGTSSLEINLERVRARVKKGGHDIPEEDQRRRFPRTLANVKKLIPLANVSMVFDNSTSQGHRLVAIKNETALELFPPVPAWAAFLEHLTTTL